MLINYTFSVGGLVGAVCTSPLDVVKTRLQVCQQFDLIIIINNHSWIQSTFYQQTMKSNTLHQSRFLLGHFIETGRLLMYELQPFRMNNENNMYIGELIK